MTKIATLVHFLARKLADQWLMPYLLGAVATIIISFALVSIWTRLRSGRWIYSADLPADTAYAIFYLGGFYTFFIGAPIFRGLTTLVTRFVPWLRLNLLAHANIYFWYLILWLAMDLVGYWWHRMVHGVPWLWEFHRIHHSETMITPLTNYRFHFVDLALRSTLQMLPALILGVPVGVWLAAAWFEIAIDSLAHADLDWSYGPIGWFLINPAFHRIHHSREPRHFDRNFSLSFSVWDRIFGTAYAGGDAPAVYGIDGPMPRSFFRQFYFPFVVLVHKLVRSAEAEPAVNKPSSGADPAQAIR